MANNQTLKDAIASVVKTNGNNEITGQLMQNALFSIINQFGSGSVFMGIATPTTAPGTPDVNQFYIAETPGTYSNFNGFILTDGLVFLNNKSGTWTGTVIKLPSNEMLKSVASGQNVNAFYQGGYVNTSANAFDFPVTSGDPNLHKVVITNCIEGQQWILISDRANQAYCWINSAGKQISRGTNGIGVFEVTAPAGAVRLAVTLEITQTVKLGDWQKQAVILKNMFYKHILDQLASINTEIAEIQDELKNIVVVSYENLNLLALPFKNGSDNMLELSDRVIAVSNSGITDLKFNDTDARFNLKTISAISNDVVNYRPYLLYRIYRKDFLNFDFSEKLEMCFAGGFDFKRNGVAQSGVRQFYVTLYYGVSDEEIRNINTFDLSINQPNKLTYIQGTASPSGTAPIANPDKDFNKTQGTISGMYIYNIPIYPSIIVNGVEQPFSGVILTPVVWVQTEAQLLVVPKEMVSYPTIAKVGYNSVNNLLDLPYSVADLDNPIYPASFFLGSNGKIRPELLPSISGTTETEISFATSDKIAFYGCSYTESYYAIKNKSWVNKLSNLLDLPLANFGVSGNRIVDISSRLRANTNPYGSVGIKQLKPSHIAIQNIGNETLHTSNVGTLEMYMAQVEEAVENAKNVGAIPLLGTEHIIGNVGLDSALREYAENNGILYVPVGTIVQKVMPSVSGRFFGGAHPGTRTNESTVEEWQNVLRNIDIKQSIKVFRVREEYLPNVTGISNLNYDALFDRVKKFIEINVGEKALDETNTSWQYYDNLANTGLYNSPTSQNEYLGLISGANLSFNKYALIEFISPKVKVTATIKIKGSSGLKFYLKNSNVPIAPYSISRNNGAFQVSKEIYDGFNDLPGEAYTSNSSGAVQITYAGKYASEEMGGYWLIFNANDTLTGGAGVLTKVSGGATTAYQRCYFNLSRYTAGFFAGMHKPEGNFEEIAGTYDNGTYTIEVSDYKFWQYDKLRLIIESPATFNLSDAKCIVTGGINKVTRLSKMKIKDSGELNLTTDTGFGSTVWNDVWQKDDGIEFAQMPTNVRDYPALNPYNSHVVLTELEPGFSNKIKKTFTITPSRGYRTLIVRVTARMFPKIFNTTVDDDYFTTTRQITTTSFDYGKLCLAIGMGGIPAVHKRLVGIGWAEKYFELTIPPFLEAFDLSLYREPGDFNIDWSLADSFPLQVNDISVALKQSV